MNRTPLARTLRVAALIITVALPLCAPHGDTPASGELLRVPCRVTGYVGGESHDTYRIAVTKGERLEVRLDWRQSGRNRAEGALSADPDFGGGSPLSNGQWSRDGKRWTGTIDESGVLYLFVVAHPSAHYTVTIRRAGSNSDGVIQPPAIGLATKRPN